MTLAPDTLAPFRLAPLVTELPLSRRALAVWWHWRRAQDDRERSTLERQAKLHPDETRALERLRANLAACGPCDDWYTEHARTKVKLLKAEIVRRLLEGLALEEAALPDFVRACLPGEALRQGGLSRAVETLLKDTWKRQREARKSAEWERKKGEMRPPLPEPAPEPAAARTREGFAPAAPIWPSVRP